MKIIFISLYLCSTSFVFCNTPQLEYKIPELVFPEQRAVTPQQDPLILLHDLMETTSRQLEQQKVLEQCILRFQESRKIYIADTQDRQAAMRMVTDAHAVLKIIQEQHLSHLLPPASMKEISFFAKFAEKKRITSP
jgi:hypothetical protein